MPTTSRHNPHPPEKCAKLKVFSLFMVMSHGGQFFLLFIRILFILEESTREAAMINDDFYAVYIK
jgi:hypothetical protein